MSFVSTAVKIINHRIPVKLISLLMSIGRLLLVDWGF